MAVDVQSPKVTWATLLTLGTLVFYSGSLTYQVNKNSETATTQWRYINSNSDKVNAADKYISRIETIASRMPAYEASNKELSKSLLALTYELKNMNDRSERDKEDKEKLEALMMSFSGKMNVMQVDIAGIKEQLKKNK